MDRKTQRFLFAAGFGAVITAATYSLVSNVGTIINLYRSNAS